jgi:hypothetical protein
MCTIAWRMMDDGMMRRRAGQRWRDGAMKGNANKSSALKMKIYRWVRACSQAGCEIKPRRYVWVEGAVQERPY